MCFLGKEKYEGHVSLGFFLVRGKQKGSNFVLKQNDCSRIRKEKDRTKPKWV